MKLSEKRRTLHLTHIVGGMSLFATAKVLWQMTHIKAELSAVCQQNVGIELLSKIDQNFGLRKSKDFFILGSGATVLTLGDKDWEKIRLGTSIGMNSWAFHPFVPDVLAIEDIHSPTLLPQRAAMLKGLDLLTNHDTKPLILNFRMPSTVDPGLKLQVPTALIQHCRKYGRFQIPSFSDSRHTRDALRAGLFLDRHRMIPGPLLIDHGASVVRMIHFALRSGAKRIVLSGVDLVGSKYFYEEDPSFLRRIDEPPFDRTRQSLLHGTVEERPGSSSILGVLRELNQVLRRDYGVELLVLKPTPTMKSVLPEISF